MEVIALTTLIRKVADILSVLALQHGRRLYWLKEDVGWIHREMGFIKSFLIDADSRPNNSHGLAHLRKMIRDLAHDVEDILDSDFSKHKRKIFMCGVGTGSRLSMEIQGIRRRVEEIKCARSTYSITEDTGAENEKQDLDHRRRFSLLVDDQWSIGLDRKIKKLTGKLLSPSSGLGVISIVGPPGVGKTTLAKIIVESSKQLGFDCAAFMHISQKPDYRDVLKDLARQVGLEKKLECQGKTLENNLYDYLSGKRVLIAFDDIWYSRTWDFLKCMIPFMCSNGSRVIMTSRDSSVAKYAARKKIFKMQTLDAKESKKLLHKLVMLNSKETTMRPVLKHIAVQILRKCGGLPLAIVSTARLLASRERSEAAWLEILKNFSSGNNGDDDWWEILAQSYYFLPTNVKPCFQTFGLFPEGYQIPAFELINLWLVEKFIQDEDVGIRCLNLLVSQNLIEVVSRGCDGKIRICKIHIVLHHLCVKLSNDNDFFQSPNDVGSYSAQRVRRMTIQYQSIGNHINTKRINLKCRSLLWFDGGHAFNKQQIREILGDLKYLRFLILEFHILESSLPDEIGSLCQLCYLRLTGNADSTLPQTIRNLKNLVTLDVKDCKHIRLPMCIWQMKQLMHLFLSGNIIVSPVLKQLGPKISNLFRQSDTFLPNLRTLDAEDGCNLKPSWLIHLSSLRKLRIRNPSDQTIELLSGALPMSCELEYLRLGWRKDRLTERLDLSYHHNVVKLHLAIPMTKLPEHDDFPPNIIKLTLLWTELEDDPMEILKRLPRLRYLKMLRNCYVGRNLMISGSGFHQLEFLQLDGLWPLEEVVCEIRLPKLKKVIIDKCSTLKSIPKRFQQAMQKRKS